MLKNIVNWIVGSFSRTLGRFLFYILLALLILLLFGGKVSAKTYYTSGYGSNSVAYMYPSGTINMELGNEYNSTNAITYMDLMIVANQDDPYYPDSLTGLNDGTYLYDYFVVSDGNLRGEQENCNEFSSNFGFYDSNSGSLIESSSRIKSQCVNSYYTRFEGKAAYHYLVQFTLYNVGETDPQLFRFRVANYTNGIVGRNGTFKVISGSVVDYDISIVEEFRNQQYNQNIYNQNQTIIDQNTETNNKLDTQIEQEKEAETTRKGIWQSLKDGISSIGTWFTQLGDKIGGFFDNLLTGIIDGLKSLFVPTEEQLQEIIDKSSELAENFGFVGETIDFFIDIFTSLLGMVNGEGCITLPKFEIGETSLFDAHTFWEEKNVCLADNTILNDNIDTIRIITSITLVCLFLGFASRQFFKILSKSESESDTE